mgnify:CR=1 FL=1
MLNRPAHHRRNEYKSRIAPDTSDWNFFTADHALQDLLALYLAPDLLEHLAPHLTELGRRAAGDLDEAAHLADRPGDDGTELAHRRRPGHRPRAEASRS